MDEILLYLSLREVKRHGDFVPPEPRQVVVVGKLTLQVGYLVLCESRAFLAVPICAEGYTIKIKFSFFCCVASAIFITRSSIHGTTIKHQLQIELFKNLHCSVLLRSLYCIFHDPRMLQMLFAPTADLGFSLGLYNNRYL